MDDALAWEIVRQIGCPKCIHEHLELPESVSCYCDCHEGYDERWAKMKPRLIKEGLLDR